MKGFKNIHAAFRKAFGLKRVCHKDKNGTSLDFWFYHAEHNLLFVGINRFHVTVKAWNEKTVQEYVQIISMWKKTIAFQEYKFCQYTLFILDTKLNFLYFLHIGCTLFL